MALADTRRSASSRPSTRGPAVVWLAELGELCAFSFRVLRAIPASFRYTAEILRQTAILVRNATPLLGALCFFIGFSQTTFAFFVLNAIGAADFGSAFSGETTPKITAPFMSGFAFTAVIGASLVAEIGVMRINEEIDAYEAEGISPVRFVVATRVVATLLFTPIATAVALMATGLGSFLNLTAVTGDVNVSTYWHYYWGLEALPDLVFATVVIAILAMTTALVGCYFGYHAKGGPAGVGRAVSRSLIVNLPLTQAISGLASFLIYGANLNLHLPFGG